MARLAKLFHLSHVRYLYDMFRSSIDGVEWFVAAYLICVICFFIIGKEILSLTFVYPVGFMLFTIYNPFLIVPLAQYISLLPRFRRIFWLLPVNLLLAYTAVTLVHKPARQAIKLLVAALLGAAILSVGSSSTHYLQMPQNIYKTSNTILEISDLLEKDSAEQGRTKRVLYSSQQLLELRQYDPSIRGLLRRYDLLDWSLPDTSEKSINNVIRKKHRLHILALVSRYNLQIDPDVFLDAAKYVKVDYIIQETDSNMADYLETAGFEQIATIGIYDIFRAAY